MNGLVMRPRPISPAEPATLGAAQWHPQLISFLVV
jgi:hypothetical protein